MKIHSDLGQKLWELLQHVIVLHFAENFLTGWSGLARLNMPEAPPNDIFVDGDRGTDGPVDYQDQP